MAVAYKDPITAWDEEQELFLEQQRLAKERERQELFESYETEKAERKVDFLALHSKSVSYKRDYKNLEQADHLEEVRALAEGWANLLSRYEPKPKRKRGRSGNTTEKQSHYEVGAEGKAWNLYGIERNASEKKPKWKFITRTHWYRLLIEDTSILTEEWANMPAGTRMAIDKDIYARAGLNADGKTIFVEFTDGLDPEVEVLVEVDEQAADTEDPLIEVDEQAADTEDPLIEVDDEVEDPAAEAELEAE